MAALNAWAPAGRRALPGVPCRPLIATGALGERLPARRVAAMIARGLQAGGVPAPDVLGLAREDPAPDELSELLDAQEFDARMRAARAVILGQRCLREQMLAGSGFFEIATRARQAGVPAYAVAGANRLERFDARILDLQVIIEAGSGRALVAAGRSLAGYI